MSLKLCFLLLSVGAPLALASAAVATPKESPAPMTPEQCAEDWMGFSGMAKEEALGVCQCIEDKKRAHPLDADKASQLEGPGGLDNAGPWPDIYQYCLQPYFGPLHISPEALGLNVSPPSSPPAKQK